MRLIDADKIKLSWDFLVGGELFDFYDISEIDNAPTIDAEPVRHGHWICGKAILNRQTCSCCGSYFDMLEAENYCPNCGAKMDEEEPK